jgi:thiamine biosynthesis lipoprotein
MLLAILASFLAPGCSGKSVEVVETHAASDIKVTVRAVAPTEKIARAAALAAWKEMETCVRLLDRDRKPSAAWLAKDAKARIDAQQVPSDVWRINDAAGKGWTVEIDPITATCLGACKEALNATGSVFDPTVGPLVDLWRDAEKRKELPTEAEIAKARAAVGFDRMEMAFGKKTKASEEVPAEEAAEDENPENMTYSVGLHKGTSLDLDGIRRGYMAGRMASRMSKAGAKAGTVTIAGTVSAYGEQPRTFTRYTPGQPAAEVQRTGGDKAWLAAVQDPRFPSDATKTFTTLRIENLSASTCDLSRGALTILGRHYSPIIDPKTGRPVSNSIASVTVVGPDPALAEAYAVAVAAMGVDEGMKMIGAEGAECLILEVAPKDGKAWQAGDPLGETAELIPHRSSGMAALETKAEAGGE